MMPRSKVVRDSHGREHVLVDLVDFQALLDVSEAAEHGIPKVRAVIRRLREGLGGPHQDVGDLEEFLAEYDAAQGAS